MVLLLAALIVFEIAVSVGIGLHRTIARREKEAELKFRLRSYKAAILEFRRQRLRFPTRLDELLTDPPNPRFLRQLYPDPVATDGRWTEVRGQDGVSITGVRCSSEAFSMSGDPLKAWDYDDRLQFMVWGKAEVRR